MRSAARTTVAHALVAVVLAGACSVESSSRNGDAGSAVGGNADCPCDNRTLECACDEVQCPPSVAAGIDKLCPWVAVERGCGKTALRSFVLGAHEQLYVYDDATGELVGVSSYASNCGDIWESHGSANWGSMLCSNTEACNPCGDDAGVGAELPPCEL